MGTLVLTITLNLLCILVVAMRTWTRWRMGTFSLDDGLMAIALGVFTACCIFTCLAVYSGLGTPDAGLEAWNMTTTTKVGAERRPLCPSLAVFLWSAYADGWDLQNIIFFQITYAWSLPFIKSSICLTMLRIITDKPLRIVIWVCMVASIASASKYLARTMPLGCSSSSFPSVSALCSPVDLLQWLDSLPSWLSASLWTTIGTRRSREGGVPRLRSSQASAT